MVLSRDNDVVVGLVRRILTSHWRIFSTGIRMHYCKHVLPLQLEECLVERERWGKIFSILPIAEP